MLEAWLVDYLSLSKMLVQAAAKNSETQNKTKQLKRMT